MTFEQLKEVNAHVARIEVKGKAYAVVAARVQAFRELFPNGSIVTEIVSMEDGVVTMRTTVADEEGRVLATGLAQEKETSSYINKTSYIENCETSAVGRALGMLGIGSDEQMASAEEVSNAIRQQEISRMKIDGVKAAALVKAAERSGVTIEQICRAYTLENLEDMTEGQYLECVKQLNKRYWDMAQKRARANT